MENKKIVIITDGKETHARLYDGNKVIKSAIAKCSPDDKFDFNIGAKLAFERLMKEEKYEWRVVNRPAKVGDYIRLLSEGGHHFNKVGDILKVDEVKTSTGGVRVLGKNHPRDTNDPNWLWYYTRAEFEVVERVGAKKVEQPKYYNGKVVCVESGLSFWTAGKVYKVKEGNLVDDDGDIRQIGAITFNDIYKWTSKPFVNVKFIPYVD